MLKGGWHGRQLVKSAKFAPKRWKRTRMKLPEAQEGALKRATSGLAVEDATGVAPETREVSWKSAATCAVSWVLLLRTVTCTWELPCQTPTVQAKVLDWL